MEERIKEITVEKIGRNDICPCGSGKKYKKCCLEKERGRVSRMHDDAAVAKQALDWLGKKYPDGVREAVFGGFLGALKKRERETVGSLSSEMQELINVNIGEWLLTDAKIPVQDGEKPVREIFMEGESLPLTTEGMKWLADLRENPLSLYEIRSVEPGEGMLLSDMLRPESPGLRVRERKASKGLLRWETLGARLMRSGDDWTLSGALYPLPREVANSCRSRIQRKTRGEDPGSLSFREICGSLLREDWLKNAISEHLRGDAEEVSISIPSPGDFETWAEGSLPEIGDRSPRKAIKTPAGRRAVIELLKSFELREARRTLKDGGKPMDLSFLWEGLGLNTEDA